MSGLTAWSFAVHAAVVAFVTCGAIWFGVPRGANARAVIWLAATLLLWVTAGLAARRRTGAAWRYSTAAFAFGGSGTLMLAASAFRNSPKADIYLYVGIVVLINAAVIAIFGVRAARAQ